MNCVLVVLGVMATHLCAVRAAPTLVDVVLNTSHQLYMPTNMGYGVFPSGVSMHAGPGDSGSVVGVACQGSGARPQVLTMPRTAQAASQVTAQTFSSTADCPWCQDSFQFGRYTAAARLPDGGFAFVASSSSSTSETTEGAFAFRTGANSALAGHRLRCGVEGDGISTGSGSMSMTPDGQYIFMQGKYYPSTLRNPVCVLRFNGTGYVPVQILESIDPVIYNDAFGAAMDTSGFTPQGVNEAPQVVFGSHYRGGSDQGAVEVARLNSSGLWELDYVFPAPSGTIRGLGRQVSISGDTVVTSTTRVSAGASIASRVFVYEKFGDSSSRSWILKTELLPPPGVNAFNDNFGSDVAIAGDLILVSVTARSATIAYARNSSGEWEPIARIVTGVISLALTCEHAFFLRQTTGAMLRLDSVPILNGRTGCVPPGASIATTGFPTTATPATSTSAAISFPTSGSGTATGAALSSTGVPFTSTSFTTATNASTGLQPTTADVPSNHVSLGSRKTKPLSTEYVAASACALVACWFL